MAAVVLLSLTPAPPAGTSHDKLGHAMAYFLLMAWFAQIHRRRWLIALGLLGLGIALEYLQILTGRSFEVLDMAADALGIFLAWVLVRGRLARGLAWLDRRL
ncbi:MAG: VanZ family protein [Gammaproteobacteria bacterium]|nr:MAG: VanZ family protein [Gammaproteobacteria bacterium]